MHMMERAIRLRPALNTFFNNVQNWWEAKGACENAKPAVLQILVKLLKPFKVATKQLQGSSVPGVRSTLW